jgi:hypothetical protein
MEVQVLLWLLPIITYESMLGSQPRIIVNVFIF